jgi:bis(5'-nucleosyl)-tetraphosphatase (symmetrical)
VTPTTVIGDLQGCAERFDALLAQAPAPRLWLTGDLVNRGPASLQALRTVRAHPACTTVLGNHDLHLLAAAAGLKRPGKSDTLQEILDAPDRDELLEWLRHRPLAHLEEGYLLVHAGVLPQWTAGQTRALAAEVETVLRGPDWKAFLAQMYGNQPSRWDDGLRGADRLRCIVNALTRIRFCTAEGEMEFATKDGGVEAAPTGYLAWFDVPDRRTQDVTVVFGHWSAQGLVMRPNLIGLDTGCVWGGKLTAVRLPAREVFQVPCPQHRAPGKPQ